MKRMNFEGNKKLRKEMALKRQEARAKRSDELQLMLLRDGGHGHCREALRLEQRIAKKKEVEEVKEANS